MPTSCFSCRKNKSSKDPHSYCPDCRQQLSKKKSCAEDDRCIECASLTSSEFKSYRKALKKRRSQQAHRASSNIMTDPAEQIPSQDVPSEAPIGPDASQDTSVSNNTRPVDDKDNQSQETPSNADFEDFLRFKKFMATKAAQMALASDMSRDKDRDQSSVTSRDVTLQKESERDTSRSRHKTSSQDGTSRDGGSSRDRSTHSGSSRDFRTQDRSRRSRSRSPLGDVRSSSNRHYSDSSDDDHYRGSSSSRARTNIKLTPRHCSNVVRFELEPEEDFIPNYEEETEEDTPTPLGRQDVLLWAADRLPDISSPSHGTPKPDEIQIDSCPSLRVLTDQPVE